MSEMIRIRRGLDIRLQGKADKIYLKAEKPGFYAVKPSDFKGLLPKLIVKPGDPVKAGSPLFYDKNNPEVKICSPVSGIVSAINRGERRVIQEVVIEASGSEEALSFQVSEPSSLSREQVTRLLLDSGLWALIRQRPYSTIPKPGSVPKSIFISGFDSAPLAPDLDFIVKDQAGEFQKGIDALSKLTDGKVHLCIDGSSPAGKTFTGAKGVQLHHFSGPHPSGNVGIQIHHIDPVNKGEKVWFLKPQDVVSIGRFFIDGKPDHTVVIALTGSEVLKPAYYKITRGASVSCLISGTIRDGDPRIISGNVLTGAQLSRHGFIGYYDHQLTVIPEGKHHEFLGWALPGFGKFSVSRAFFSWLSPSKEFRIDTNLKGGHRAFVMTGEYEKVLPMDIHPVHLLKAILVEDIDKMEQLGIYEVSEEDFALCEFVCTSKTDVQEIISKGLELIRKETE